MRMLTALAVLGLVFSAHAARADALWGAIDGALGGAILGGIIDGGEGAADGAVIGGVVGGVAGAADEYDRSRGYYDRRYDRRYYEPPRYRQPAPQRQRAPRRANLVAETQLALRRLGYNPGPADGRAGRNTARAVTAYQRDNGLPADGRITSQLLQHLRQRGG